MTVQSKSPEQIESEIRSTRRDIDRTLDALQTRLSPGQLLDQALGYVKSGGGEFASNFGRTIAQNPVPVTLLGIGVLWLMCSRPQAQVGGNGESHEYMGRATEWGDTTVEATEATAQRARQWSGEARDRASAAAETAGEYVQAAGDTVRGYAQGAGEAARRAAHHAESYADTAWRQSARAGETARRIVDDYPFVVGALGLAVGALAAALLPSTRREDELMGRTADELKKAASGVIKEQTEMVQEAARSTEAPEPSGDRPSAAEVSG
jgi:Protein of unknown function (DUF3618)